MLRMYVALLLLSVGATAYRVEIFRDTRFAGLIYDEEIQGEQCVNLPGYALGLAGSLRTTQCLMVYEQLGCAGNSFKLSRDMTNELEDLRRTINSFHACTDDYGGDKIQVDMYNGNTLIGEYFDICGCQSYLPSQVSTRLTRLDNHGNCITAYAGETCTGPSEVIPAGRNGLTEDVSQLGFYIRSIGACGNRKKCVRLSASIFKFVILDPEEDTPDPIPQEVELGTSTFFFNNGSATITQEYEARNKVRESVTIEHSKSIKEMETKVVEKTKVIETKHTVKILFVKITRTVTETFKDTYTYENTEENEQTESYTKETETEYVVRQRFQVPPCVQYEVSSAVSKMEDYPLRYETYAKVTGTASGVKLTAEEVSEMVDGMEFVELLDEYTAIFKTTQTIQVSMGIDTVITAFGSEIEGCREAYLK